MLIGVVIASVVSGLVFVQKIRDDMDSTIRTAVDGLDREIDAAITRIGKFEEFFGSTEEIARLIYRKDVFSLNNLMLSPLEMSVVDTITVTDEAGRILSRPRNVVGDNQTAREYVEAALAGKSLMSIPARSPMKLGVFRGAPIMLNSEIRGAVVVGVDLGKTSMLTRLSNMYRAELSLFYGDSRISTTLRNEENQEWGMGPDPDIIEDVIGRGQLRFSDTRLWDGTMLRAVYRPFVFNHKIVGMLAAGVRTGALENAIRDAGVRVFFTVLAVILLVAPGSWMFSMNVSRLAEEKTKQERYLRLLMKSSPDIILLFDSDRKFIDCTETFLRRIGIGSDAILGRTFSEVMEGLMVPLDVKRLCDALDEAAREGKTVSLESIFDLSGEDSPHAYSIRFTPMLDDESKTTGVMGLFHDVSSVLQAQKAEAASHAKTAFLANMSHEIRTPLNAVIGLSEIELLNDLPGVTHENIEKIYASGSTLLGIINDILDISKIESGKFEVTPTIYDSASLISDTVHLNMTRLASKPINFRLELDEDLPSSLYGDEIRMKQILNNLLSNAFKYTREGSVTLGITCRVRGRIADLTYSVSDTGIGIKKEDMEKLFSQYKQFDSYANRKIEGTGLGLSITRSLVELMGGTIKVHSEYGKGSTFTVVVPQNIVDFAPIGPETAQNLRSFHIRQNRSVNNFVRRRMTWGKVLIVDDVVTNQEVARGLMMPYGLTIHCASSGREAIDLVREGKIRYDIIFMDHMRPEMDGVEAVRIIRNEINTEYARSVPIIALTANALAGNQDMFLQRGFQASLFKPVDIVKLDKLLNEWIPGQGPDGEDAEPSYAGVASTPLDSELDATIMNARIDGIDLAKGLSGSGDAGTYLKILQSYATHIAELLDKIRDVSEETLAGYAITIHGIKGASLGIFAPGVGEMAQTLEDAAKRGDLNAVKAGNGAFIEATEALILNLRALLDRTLNLPGDRERQRLSEPDVALLEHLLDRTRHYDTSGMEAVMSELERFSYDSGDELVEWLRKKVNDLEYDEIVRRLADRINATPRLRREV
jgi:PAS domain S-box-containing protein